MLNTQKMERADGKLFRSDFHSLELPESVLPVDLPNKKVVEVKKGLWILINQEKDSEAAKQKLLGHIEKHRMDFLRFNR